MPGEDLGIAQRDSGVEGVGDRCASQRVRTDVAWDASGGLRDALHHPVDVAAINGLPRHRSQHQWSPGPLSSQALRTRTTGTVSDMVAGDRDVRTSVQLLDLTPRP